MGHAYTPGLKVKESLLVKKQRILPLKGDVMVKVGDKVSPDDVVARTELPGNVVPINVANKLGIPPEDIEMVMLKKVGDPIEEGELMALSKTLFIFKNTCNATINGTLESISTITGQVLQRGMPSPVEVKAYLEGEVTQVFPNEGVEVQCMASFVQGIFGIGGERNGPIHMAVSNNTEVLDEKAIDESMAGKIIVGGSLVTAEALKKANEVGVLGIVVGGFDDKDMRDFLGYDIGVAITGAENIVTSLVVTEGFGQINIAAKTFDLIKRHEGEIACINGATQIRAGVIRPEIVIPAVGVPVSENAADEEVKGLAINSPVRVIRHPYFGQLGTVTDLPSPLHVLGSESKARILGVKFDSGEEVIVPRANVEMIES
ncbi:MAG: hypothetical protein J7J98_02505 [candidate division Zixibacteria bacterium]|nr:hypothetical protein [candidate division Zixibacteria bacterium]